MRATRFGLAASAAVLLALGLAGCGGDAKPTITKVYVMGDSLADVGTFGFKFTVQEANNPKGFPIWPQLVADKFGVNGTAQCNFFAASSPTAFSQNPACTNYAIGGARIAGNSGNPRMVGTQMAAKLLSGEYLSTDLVLMDGGGNDAADLVEAYQGATTGSATGIQTYRDFLLQQLDVATVTAFLTPGTPNGPVLAAGAYMQKLADTFYGQIKANALDKGAVQVAVLNMPDITLTPDFKAVLAGIASFQSPAAAQALNANIRVWIGAFNTQFKARIGTDNRVVLVDFYAEFKDQVNNPGKFGLTNVTTPLCPAGFETPAAVAACTQTAIEVGKTPGWWVAHAFSDGFHPTPRGHSLLADSVTRALTRAGWL